MTLPDCVSSHMLSRPQSGWFLRGPSVPEHFLPHRRGYSIDLSASRVRRGGKCRGGELCYHGNSGVECRALNCIKMMLSPPKSLNLNRCWGGVEGTWTDARMALSEIKSKRAAPSHISISVLLLHISGGHPDRYVDNRREREVKWRFVLCPVMQEHDISQGII